MVGLRQLERRASCTVAIGLPLSANSCKVQCPDKRMWVQTHAKHRDLTEKSKKWLKMLK